MLGALRLVEEVNFIGFLQTIFAFWYPKDFACPLSEENFYLAPLLYIHLTSNPFHKLTLLLPKKIDLPKYQLQIHQLLLQL